MKNAGGSDVSCAAAWTYSAPEGTLGLMRTLAQAVPVSRQRCGNVQAIAALTLSRNLRAGCEQDARRTRSGGQQMPNEWPGG